MTNWRRPSALSPALIAIIAVVGISFVALVLLLLINLLNGPGPAASPRPTGRPTAPTTLAPGATPPPTSDAPATNGAPTAGNLTPPPSPAPGGSLTPEQALVAHVPEPIRASCTVEPGSGQADLVAHCAADGGALTINYLQFATAEAMATAYDNRFEQSQIERNTGRCEDYATWPAESEYSVSGEITGRRLCTEVPGAPTIYWTDDRLNIMGQATADGATVDRLLEFWTNESGPFP